jgi:hypothetical protein
VTALKNIATTSTNFELKNNGISTGRKMISPTSIGAAISSDTSICLFTVSLVASMSVFTAERRGK